MHYRHAMASLTEIRAYLALTKSANIKASEMIALIDYAIASQITDGEGKYIVSATDDDVTLVNGSLEDLQKARAFYASIGDTGGVIDMPLEMRGY